MSAWFEVNTTDIVDIVEKRKDQYPWGDYPDQKYSCLILWKNGRICMTVDEFYKVDDNKYSCLDYYTTVLANTVEGYNDMPEEDFVVRAYNTWMSGAR